MTDDRTSFCRSLREKRARRGLTLDAIGESSKISVSLLAALERGDLSRWPKGIFRRSFFREYAVAIGLPPEPVVAELGRLFPEDGERIQTSGGPTEQDGADSLRLSLAEEASRIAPAVWRAMAASLDAAAVILVGAVVAWAAAGSFQTIAGVVGLIYYGSSTACAGATPAFAWLNRRGVCGAARLNLSVSKPAAVDRLRIVFRGPGWTPPSVAESVDTEPAREKLQAASR